MPAEPPSWDQIRSRARCEVVLEREKALSQARVRLLDLFESLGIDASGGQGVPALRLLLSVAKDRNNEDAVGEIKAAISALLSRNASEYRWAELSGDAVQDAVEALYRVCATTIPRMCQSPDELEQLFEDARARKMAQRRLREREAVRRLEAEAYAEEARKASLRFQAEQQRWEEENRRRREEENQRRLREQQIAAAAEIQRATAEAERVRLEDRRWAVFLVSALVLYFCGGIGLVTGAYVVSSSGVTFGKVFMAFVLWPLLALGAISFPGGGIVLAITLGSIAIGAIALPFLVALLLRGIGDRTDATPDAATRSS